MNSDMDEQTMLTDISLNEGSRKKALGKRHGVNLKGRITYKIIMGGGSNRGQTSFIARYITGEYERTNPTIGSRCHSAHVNSADKMSVDGGDSESFKSFYFTSLVNLLGEDNVKASTDTSTRQKGIPHSSRPNYKSVFADTCTKVDSCTCKWDNGTVTSLRDLALHNAIKYKDTPDTSNANYVSYNPCYPFTEGSGCTNVALCNTDEDGLVAPYGTQDSASFSVDAGRLVITYTSTVDNAKYEGQVFLQCSPVAVDPAFSVSAVIPGSTATVLATLTDPSCCPRNAGPSSHTLSVGSVLCIIFLVVVIIYFLFGFAIRKIVMKKEGSDAIPNSTLWRSLPGYVKDGVLFVYRRGRNPGYTDAS